MLADPYSPLLRLEHENPTNFALRLRAAQIGLLEGMESLPPRSRLYQTLCLLAVGSLVLAACVPGLVNQAEASPTPDTSGLVNLPTLIAGTPTAENAAIVSIFAGTTVGARLEQLDIPASCGFEPGLAQLIGDQVDLTTVSIPLDRALANPPENLALVSCTAVQDDLGKIEGLVIYGQDVNRNLFIPTDEGNWLPAQWDEEGNLVLQNADFLTNNGPDQEIAPITPPTNPPEFKEAAGGLVLPPGNETLVEDAHYRALQVWGEQFGFTYLATTEADYRQLLSGLAAQEDLEVIQAWNGLSGDQFMFASAAARLRGRDASVFWFVNPNGDFYYRSDGGIPAQGDVLAEIILPENTRPVLIGNPDDGQVYLFAVNSETDEPKFWYDVTQVSTKLGNLDQGWQEYIVAPDLPFRLTNGTVEEWQAGQWAAVPWPEGVTPSDATLTLLDNQPVLQLPNSDNLPVTIAEYENKNWKVSNFTIQQPDETIYNAKNLYPYTKYDVWRLTEDVSPGLLKDALLTFPLGIKVEAVNDGRTSVTALIAEQKGILVTPVNYIHIHGRSGITELSLFLDTAQLKPMDIIGIVKALELDSFKITMRDHQTTAFYSVRTGSNPTETTESCQQIPLLAHYAPDILSLCQRHFEQPKIIRFSTSQELRDLVDDYWLDPQSVPLNEEGEPDWWQIPVITDDVFVELEVGVDLPF